MRRRSILLSILPSTAVAQGVPAEWDVRRHLEELRGHFAAILSELARLDLGKWRSAGAPGAYLDQVESVKRQLASTIQAVDELRQLPEKLSVALEIFLRFNAVDQLLTSILEATRKYDTQEAVDRLEAKVVDIAAPKERFRKYLLELASERDRQFDILTKEAQRCRTQTNAPSARPGKKK